MFKKQNLGQKGLELSIWNFRTLTIRALEILKSESVQPMTAHFQKKKNMYILPVTKTNDNWQSYNSF